MPVQQIMEWKARTVGVHLLDWRNVRLDLFAESVIEVARQPVLVGHQRSVSRTRALGAGQKGSYMKISKSLMVAAALAAVVTIVPLNSSPLAAGHSSRGGRETTLAVHDTWRKLWEDHITWTRIVIMGVLDNLPGTQTYAGRLLQNYEDMEDALKPFYGDEAEELGDLIQDHLLIAVDVLNAAKAGNTSALNEAVARWYQNAEDIAHLMANLNPRFWPLGETERMWREHLDATLDEAVKHLTGDFAGEVAAYDLVHTLALEMADFISRGLVRQFPSRFAGPRL
jgi:hypothetical protein